MARMRLLTKEIERKFEKNPLYSQEGKGLDSKVLVKYFNPYGAGTWLITEAEKQGDGDWLLFGCSRIQEWEWGYVLLSELQNLSINVYGYKMYLERELYSSGKLVKDLI